MVLEVTVVRGVGPIWLEVCAKKAFASCYGVNLAEGAKKIRLRREGAGWAGMRRDGGR